MAQDAWAADVTINVASAFNEETDMIRAARRFEELVEERSGGDIAVEFFTGGQMGGEKDNLEALKIGEIEMAVFGTYPIVTMAPQYSFFDAPFVFRDKQHFYDVYQGGLGDEVRRTFEDEHGVRELGLMGRGYRHITSNDPIESVADLEGVKIRMGQSKPFIEAFSEIGAVVVPIALPELFTSLKLGVVSASDGPVRSDLHVQAPRGAGLPGADGAPLCHLALADERTTFIRACRRSIVGSWTRLRPRLWPMGRS